MLLQRIVFFLSALLVTQMHAAFELKWSTPPVNLGLSLPAETLHRDIQVVLNQEGNGVVAWAATEERGVIERVWIAQYTHASRLWTSAVCLSKEENASHVSVGMDREGNATFLWEEGFPARIYQRTLFAEGTWDIPLEETALKISPSLREQVEPKIWVDQESNGVALWLEREVRGRALCTAYREKGKEWTLLPPLVKLSPKIFLQGRSSLQGNSSGRCVAVWEEENMEERSLWSAYFEKTRGWSAPTRIAVRGVGHLFEPSAAIDGRGRGLVAWLEGHVVKACRFDQDGRFEESHSTVSHPDLAASQPFVALDEKGDGLIVYTRSDRGPEKQPEYQFVSAAFFPHSNQTPLRPTDVSGPSSPLGFGCYPWVGFNTIGDGVLLWKQDDQILRGAGFSLGSWSLFQPISQPSSRSTSLSYRDYAVALNPAGQMIAVWSEKGGEEKSYKIKASLGVGLAVSSPQPPIPTAALHPEVSLSTIGVGSGTQFLCQFPGHGDLYNVLNWTYEGPVSQFRIYRGHLGDLAGTSSRPYFEDHQRPPNQQETYLITAVDADGHESAPLTLVVKPIRLKSSR